MNSTSFINFIHSKISEYVTSRIDIEKEKLSKEIAVLFLSILDAFKVLKVQKVREVIFEKFTIFYPGSEYQIACYLNNQDVLCKQQLGNFIIQNIQKTSELCIEIINEFPQDDNFYLEIFANYNKIISNNIVNMYDDFKGTFSENAIQETNSLIGQVIILNNDQEYIDTIAKLRKSNYIYNGFNVINQNNQIKLYFY